MTVKELIEELQKYPPDFQVHISDSEWPAEELNEVKLERNRDGSLIYVLLS